MDLDFHYQTLQIQIHPSLKDRNPFSFSLFQMLTIFGTIKSTLSDITDHGLYMVVVLFIVAVKGLPQSLCEFREWQSLSFNILDHLFHVQNVDFTKTVHSIPVFEKWKCREHLKKVVFSGFPSTEVHLETRFLKLRSLVETI